MQTQTLSQIKQQIIRLDPDSKKELADFLAHELDSDAPDRPDLHSDDDRRAQIEWLKRNRTEYKNKYVALVGGDMVAEGDTFADARSAAVGKGFPEAFITFVFAPEAEPFGGW
jgi:hypothetical protein